MAKSGRSRNCVRFWRKIKAFLRSHVPRHFAEVPLKQRHAGADLVAVADVPRRFAEVPLKHPTDGRVRRRHRDVPRQFAEVSLKRLRERHPPGRPHHVPRQFAEVMLKQRHPVDAEVVLSICPSAIRRGNVEAAKGLAFVLTVLTPRSADRSVKTPRGKPISADWKPCRPCGTYRRESRPLHQEGSGSLWAAACAVFFRQD